MGDIDGCGAQPLMQLADFRPHLHPQLGIQVRQRLVEQKHLRVAHNGAAHRHALALPARKLARIARKIGFQTKDIRRAVDFLCDLRLVHSLHLQRKAHVRRHCLVRVKRIVLEHHGNVAVRRRQVVDHPVPDADRPRGDAFQPGNHAQKCRFPATGRPDQNHELPVLDIDIDTVQNVHRAIGLAQVADRNLGHRSPIGLCSATCLTQPVPAVHHLGILTC